MSKTKKDETVDKEMGGLEVKKKIQDIYASSQSEYEAWLRLTNEVGGWWNYREVASCFCTCGYSRTIDFIDPDGVVHHRSCPEAKKEKEVSNYEK